MKTATKVRLTTPREAPFFSIDDEVFLDLGFNWGHPLAVPPDILLAFIKRAAPGQIVIGRRLTKKEQRELVIQRRDIDEEVYAGLIVTDAARWVHSKPRR